MSGKIILISGPCGSGKTTTCQRLAEETAAATIQARLENGNFRLQNMEEIYGL